MATENVCRTCLSTNNLNNIFENEANNYSAAIYLVSGLKILINDELPQKICAKCTSFLNELLQFRRQCIKVNKQLKNKYELETLQVNSLLDIDIGIVKSEACDIKIENDILPTFINEQIPFNDIKYEVLEEYEINIKDEEIQIFPQTDNIISENETTQKFVTLKSSEKNTERISLKTDKYEMLTCQLCLKEISSSIWSSHISKCHQESDEEALKSNVNDDLIICGTNFCSICKVKFPDLDSFIKHLNGCESRTKNILFNNKKPWGRDIAECDICHKKMQRGSITKHKNIQHQGDGPICEHCGKKFVNNTRLRDHYRAKHGYEKFKCSFCDFLFANSLALRNHEQKHSGEKPYVCDECGSKFHAAHLLTRHKTSHITQKLFKCDLCPSSFKCDNSRRSHRKSCHGPARFKCKICHQVFTCKRYAVRHLSRVHRNGDVEAKLEIIVSEDTKTS